MSEFAGVFVLLFMLSTIYKVGLYFKLETRLENKIAFISLILLSLTVLVINWPGLISIDDIYLLEQTSLGLPSAWHSFSYSFLSLGTLFLTKTPFLLSLFNLLLMCHFLIYVFSVSRWSRHSQFFGLLVFFLSLPQTTYLVFFQNRDSTYNLLLLVFLMGLLSLRFSRLPRIAPTPWTLIFMALVLGDLRQEGKFITLLAPILIFYFYDKKIRYLFHYSLACALGAVVLFWVPTITYTNFDPYSAEYKITAFLNPVTYIINKVTPQNIDPQLKADIDSVVDIDAIVQHPNPYDIDVFHSGGIRTPITGENFDRYRSASLELIFQHLDLYLDNRLLIFKRMFLFEPQHHESLFFDSLRGSLIPKHQELLKEFSLSERSPSYNVAESITYHWMSFFTYYLPLPLHLLISSCLLSFISLLCCIAFYRKNPFVAVIALIVLFRSILILALTPAAHFKYITSTWIMGWILAILFFKMKYEEYTPYPTPRSVEE